MKAVSPEGPNRVELMRTMMPHPLVYQELPFDPEFGLYDNRLVALLGVRGGLCLDELCRTGAWRQG
ncbi:MAG: hypothetical protein P8X75_06625 [Limibacillus sp.]